MRATLSCLAERRINVLEPLGCSLFAEIAYGIHDVVRNIRITARVIESRVSLIPHDVLVHGSERGVLLLVLVVSLWRLKGRQAARQKGSRVHRLVALLSQALLRLGRQCLVIEPRLLWLSHGQR